MKKIMNKYNDKEKYTNKDLFLMYSETKDLEIRNELVSRHLYIAEILAKKYMNKGIDYEDIYQVASLGLIFAIERYSLDKGYEFSSFATPTIIGEIKKYFRDKGWSIRVPRRIQELAKKINSSKHELNQILQRTPTIRDIANYLECTEEEIIEAMEGSQVYSPKSIDISYDNGGDDKDVNFLELLGENDKNFDQVENNDFIKMVIKKLNPIEKKILNQRFFENETQMKVAKDLSVSQMTVSRIEKRIIEKFKKEYKRTNV